MKKPQQTTPIFVVTKKDRTVVAVSLEQVRCQVPTAHVYSCSHYFKSLKLTFNILVEHKDRHAKIFFYINIYE